MSRRSYSQACPLAAALDLLGERWTLLIARDLLLGPLRFTDLLCRLPGLGRNLLSKRLQDLEAQELVTRTQMEPPAASIVYELTDKGRGLEPALLALTDWAMQWRLHEVGGEAHLEPDMLGLALQVKFDPTRAPPGVQFHEFVADGQPIHVRVGGGRAVARRGRVVDPLIRLTAETKLFQVALTTKMLDIGAEEQGGKLTIEGARSALPTALGCYGVEVRTGPYAPPTSGF